MKLQIISDIHLDSWSMEPPTHCNADVCIIAGDLHEGILGLPYVYEIALIIPVIVVPGNHEFYGSSIQTVTDQWRAIANEHQNIHFLDNSSLVLDGVRFIGSTLWTDFRGGNPQDMLRAPCVLKDYIYIKNNDGESRVTADALYEEHLKSAAYIKEQLQIPYDGKTVVVTHHAPSHKSVHPSYEGDRNNCLFHSDLDNLMAYYNIDMWIHGHLHTTSDYILGETNVVANPRGTPNHPNPDFDPYLVKNI